MGRTLQLLMLVGCLAAVLRVEGTGLARRRKEVQTKVACVNANGPHIGIVVPDPYEMNPLLKSSIFTRASIPHIDISGRRFHLGTIESRHVIVVMCGIAMVNAGITTQLLLDYFDISGVLHYGIAGNANDELNIGDITIPKYFAHTGLWNWQRYGQGPNDTLPFEENGDFTREIGYLHFGDYNNPPQKHDNYLNNVWFQPEQVFIVTGTPEVREHHFWVPVNKAYLEIAKKIEGIELFSCINSSFCLQTPSKVVVVERGASANVFVDNSAYRAYLRKKFDVSTIDMESASVALVCLANDVPFIAIRALSDLAGKSPNANQAAIFASLASKNAALVMQNFIKNI